MQSNTDINKTDPITNSENNDREFSVSSSSAGSSHNRLSRLSRLGHGMPKLSRRFRSATVGMAVGTVLVSALVGYGAGHFEAQRIAKNGVVTTSIGSQKQIVTSESQLIGNIARTVGPSVVSVNVTSTAQGNGGLFGYGSLP
jgi:hypothetical protein